MIDQRALGGFFVRTVEVKVVADPDFKAEPLDKDFFKTQFTIIKSEETLEAAKETAKKIEKDSTWKDLINELPSNQ